MNILGIDGGFGNLGWSVVEIGASTARLVELGCVTTKPSQRKVLKTDDNIQRCRELVRALRPVWADSSPVAIAAESMSWPRNASSSAKIGIAWGVVITLAELLSLPIIATSPQGIKKALTNDASASKAKVQAAVEAIHGFENLAALLEPIVKTRREHPVDATAAVIAALDTEIVRAIRHAGAKR